METTKKPLRDTHKIHIVLFVAAALLWGVTFITDQRIFTKDALNMNCLPIDSDMAPLMHVLTKIVVLLVIWGILEFFRYGLQHKKLLFFFAGLLILYLVLLLCSYPGYYMSDDTIIFGYATRYYPVYWHHYLTSLYYMVGMSLFPASTGPIILNDLCLSMVFAYICYQMELLYKTRLRHLILLCAIAPFVLLSGLMCFRPALYAPFFLFFFAFLFFEKKGKKALTLPKLLLLAALTAILCTWRSEGIVLIVFCLFLIPICYGKNWKRLALFLLAFAAFFTAVRIPQSKGEAKYYGSDYLIISTIRPLSLIIHREQTYPGAEEDLSHIDSVIDLDYISYETLSCSSYNRYNSDYNAGHFTETGADVKTQRAYLKSAFRLILHNLDLYFAERLQLFLVTNGIYDYDPALVMGLEPVTTSEFQLYQSDKAYGYELVEGNQRLPLTGSNAISSFLFTYGGEAYLPILILLIIGCIVSLLTGKWFFFWSTLSLLAREAVIFLTAPASFIQYSYPTMFATVFILLIWIINDREDLLS